jgi:hypothetical protein
MFLKMRPQVVDLLGDLNIKTKYCTVLSIPIGEIINFGLLFS